MAPTSPLWQQGIRRACPALARLHAKQAPDGNRDLRYSSLAKFEKNSGIDRVIQTAELFQLPAPDFRLSSSRTLVVIYGPRKFEGMDRGDRVRACYQHCALKWVMSERMTNQTLRDRFRLAEGKSAFRRLLRRQSNPGWLKPTKLLPVRGNMRAISPPGPDCYLKGRGRNWLGLS